MNRPIARRYAKALFDLARQEKQMDAVREKLDGLDRLIQTQPDLLALCRNPVYRQEEKKRVLGSEGGSLDIPDPA